MHQQPYEILVQALSQPTMVMMMMQIHVDLSLSLSLIRFDLELT
jgi:hypothetical protein